VAAAAEFELVQRGEHLNAVESRHNVALQAGPYRGALLRLIIRLT
jgi:hypothetical protein